MVYWQTKPFETVRAGTVDQKIQDYFFCNGILKFTTIGPRTVTNKNWKLYSSLRAVLVPLDREWAIDGLSIIIYPFKPRPRRPFIPRKTNPGLAIQGIWQWDEGQNARTKLILKELPWGDKIWGLERFIRIFFFGLEGMAVPMEWDRLFKAGRCPVTEMTDSRLGAIGMKKGLRHHYEKGGRNCHASLLLAREIGVLL